jgi:hypothetical protein
VSKKQAVPRENRLFFITDFEKTGEKNSLHETDPWGHELLRLAFRSSIDSISNHEISKGTHHFGLSNLSVGKFPNPSQGYITASQICMIPVSDSDFLTSEQYKRASNMVTVLAQVPNRDNFRQVKGLSQKSCLKHRMSSIYCEVYLFGVSICYSRSGTHWHSRLFKN